MAYRPTLATIQRANIACHFLGITGWHLLKPEGKSGPRLFYKLPNGQRVIRNLVDLEAEVAERGGRLVP